MHDVAQPQEQFYHHHRHQHGEGDVAHPLPDVSPVQRSRFIQLLIDSRQHGQIQHRSVSGLFPHRDQRKDQWPKLRLHIKVNPFPASRCDDGVNHTRVIIQQSFYDISDRHIGNKCRQDHDAVGILSYFLKDQFVDGNGQRNAAYRFNCGEQQIIGNRIAGNAPICISG